MESLLTDRQLASGSAHPLIRPCNWMEGGTGLTNFNPKDEPIYLAAIAAFGDPNYVVAHAPCTDAPCYIPTDYSLHRLDVHTAETDSGPFWKVFKAMREANTPLADPQDSAQRPVLDD